jgi:hypothetical protein
MADRVNGIDHVTGQVVYLNAGERLVQSSFSLNYEYILIFSKSAEKRLVPSLGFGLNPYYFRTSSFPASPADFRRSETRTGINLFVNPRLNYYLGPKFFIDLNIPINIYNFFWDIYTNRDPRIPVKYQTYTNIDWELLPSVYSLRLGIGMKL